MCVSLRDWYGDPQTHGPGAPAAQSAAPNPLRSWAGCWVYSPALGQSCIHRASVFKLRGRAPKDPGFPPRAGIQDTEQGKGKGRVPLLQAPRPGPLDHHLPLTRSTFWASMEAFG